MYLCYLDESGSPDDPNNQHFVLAGIALPANQWKALDSAILAIKKNYGLEATEIHTGWMMRRYSHEQKITNFSALSVDDRRAEVNKIRIARESALAAAGDKSRLNSSVTERKRTSAYVHLTHDERIAAVRKIADKISSWQDLRLFGGAIDKAWFNKVPRQTTLFEFAFENIVNRFQAFLSNRSKFLQNHNRDAEANDCIGILIEDNNVTMASKVTSLMRKFHKRGTLFRKIDRIIETPLFVDSELTCMIQIADIAAYSIRRFLDNRETNLFDLFYQRVDKAADAPVGLRHFTESGCL
ncbi:MAG: DUF3800 domain-containing protein, partial [Elusimicrobiota bacterium]